MTLKQIIGMVVVTIIISVLMFIFLFYILNSSGYRKAKKNHTKYNYLIICKCFYLSRSDKNMLYIYYNRLRLKK